MPGGFRVAIIGGGYAGFELAKLLDPHLDVSLIEAREAFVHNVGAPRSVAEPGLIEQLVFPYDRLLKRGRVVRARVASVDAGGAVLTDGTRVDADAIVVATGSSYAAPFKPQGDSTAEFVAALHECAAQVAAAARIVIVGAGAVGVELAGEIKAIYRDKPVTLVSAPAQLFPMYRAELHAALASRLAGLGVELHLGQTANGLTRTDRPYQGEITLANGTRLAGLIFPAIGARVTDSPAHALPNAQRQPNGQLQVDPWLRPSSLANIFAIGDLAATGEGMTVVSASRHAPWLAGTLRKLASGKALEALPAYKPWKVPPILIPLGPGSGASVLPLGARGMVVGDWLTGAIKGKKLFIPRYEKEFGQ
ncbi:NAD(P)/FAD-dependent oxidoreductase [Novosphingobium sp. B 225]|uniref:NAD(P)/FAD-dependent oxidoreductase n=1 Tax=Novosphingobium sp. B 225 TaxID=1961849 RepID=UPI000B4AB6C1|nr:NAD(P)/FAD-dependent oxidoreductase [Novosphingobium sp. B 225]